LTLARKQELNTQLQQLIDALLPAVSLWVACVLRFTPHPGSISHTWSIHSGTINGFWWHPVRARSCWIRKGVYQSPLYLYI